MLQSNPVSIIHHYFHNLYFCNNLQQYNITRKINTLPRRVISFLKKTESESLANFNNEVKHGNILNIWLKDCWYFCLLFWEKSISTQFFQKSGMPSFSSCAPEGCSLFLKSEPTALLPFSAVHPTGCEEERVFILCPPDRHALHSSRVYLGAAGLSQRFCC